MQNIIIADFFQNQLPEATYNVIFTDPPYGAFQDQLNYPDLSLEKMWEEFLRTTPDRSAIILFANDQFMKDLFRSYPDDRVEFWTKIKWKKGGNTRNWSTWAKPPSNTENLLFFRRGDFKFDFRTGVVKPKIKRGGFGNVLKNRDHQIKPNPNEESYEMFGDIWEIPLDKNRIHPTQKPIEFSRRIKWICRYETPLKVLDPFTGSGALLYEFPDATGFDIKKWSKSKRLEEFLV